MVCLESVILSRIEVVVVLSIIVTTIIIELHSLVYNETYNSVVSILI